MKQLIRKHALKNAFDFKGSVNDKVVLGAVLREAPELKTKVPEVLKEIQAVIKEISKLSPEQIHKELQKNAPELLEVKKEEKIEGPLRPLNNAEVGKVVVRIAPSPSGPLHIGHAYGSSLNYEYSKMYKGQFVLRIEDTNADNIYPPAYEMIVEDANWLSDNGVSKVIIQSERLEIYYKYAEELLTKGNAYACTCEAEAWRNMKNEGIACPCRSLAPKDNLARYKKMFNDYHEGEIVLRLKTDIKDKNPAMRDFPIMRIVENPHPKTGKKYRVWPLMIFSVAIDDHENGLTHVLNGKDHADNEIKEKKIMSLFGWTPPEYKHWGMINFEGFELSTTKTKQAIAEGKYKGWDDIRIPFLRALKRRGYQPGAFRKFAIEVGLTPNDKTVKIEEFWKSINSFNRDIVEPNANRYFFIGEPHKVKIMGAPEKTAHLDLHPNYLERGKREIHAKGEIYLEEKDLHRLEEGKLHRLMDYCNFEVHKGKYKFVSEDYESYKNAANRGAIIHWLPVEENLKAEVLMEDGSTLSGFGEMGMSKLKVNDLVQLERNFYARLDDKSKDTLKFWYLHK